MMNFKFAFVFLIVFVMYLQESQGHILPKKASKLPIVAAKVAVAKSAAAKIKLAAFKKWAAVKAIAKAPFVLGKKAALFKIGAVKAIAAAKVGAVKSIAAAKVGAVKSLAAFKLAKAKKAFGLASKKVAPAVGAISTVTKKVGPAVAAVAAIPAAAVAAIPAIAAIPAAAVAAIPAAASAAIKPLTDLVSPSKPEEDVAEVFTVPVRETHYQVVQPDVHYSSNVANSYSGHGCSVSLLPSGEYSNVYQYYPAAGVKYDTAVAAERTEENQEVSHSQTDTEVVAPHDIYGVPN